MPVVGEPELAWWIGPARRQPAGVAGGDRHERQDHHHRDARGDPARGRAATPWPAATSATRWSTRCRAGRRVLAVELSSFQLHWSPSVVPAAGVRAQRRRGPSRLARLDGRLRGGQGAGAARAGGGRGGGRPGGGRAARRGAGGAAGRGDAGRARAGPARDRRRRAGRPRVPGAPADRTRRWVLDAANAAFADPAPPGGSRSHGSPTCAPAARPAHRRAGRRRAGPRRGRRARHVAAGLAGFRPGRHRADLVGDGRRRALRRRLQGDEPARRGGVAGRAGPGPGGLGRGRPAQGGVGRRAGRRGTPGAARRRW